MNKTVLLAGASALAMGVAIAASSAQAYDKKGDGAWAKINFQKKIVNDGENLVLVQPSAGTVYGNGSDGSPTTDPGQVRPNEIVDSFNNAAGVGHVQQNEGSANSINAAGAVQTSINQTTPASSGTYVGSTVYDNYAVQLDGTRSNLINNSFHDTYGVYTVQQNNGDQNEIGSAEAVQADQNSVGDVGTFATVNSVTYGNETDQHGGSRTNDITDSFTGAAGVLTVQQNNGDHNAIGAATSVYAANGGYGDVTQGVSVYGTTYDNTGDVPFGSEETLTSDNGEAANVRTNTIDPSFNNASGVATVQQNNGNANAISAATAVGGNIGGQHNIPGPNNDNQDDVHQWVNVAGFASNYYDGEYSPVVDVVLDVFADLVRDNVIEGGSFDGFNGIATVQQNNGDNNVLGAGTAVNYNHGLSANEVQNDVKQHVSVDGEVYAAYTYDVDTGNLFGFEVRGARNNLIDTSFNNGAAGLVSVQQNNGSTNVIGVGNAVQVNHSTVAAALDGNDDVRGQKARASGYVYDNWTLQDGGPVVGDGENNDVETIVPTHRDNHITDSFVGFSGIANVQQNNGDGNVMGIANSVVASIGNSDKFDNVGSRRKSSVAETNGAVQSSYGLEAQHFLSGANRLNSIDPSFTGTEGIVTVQQNNGNNNVINAATSVVANIDPAVDPQSAIDDQAGSAKNGAYGNAYVASNYAEGHVFSDRKNEIPASFANAMGIVTVQQNNGDNNVLGASTAVVADIDTGFGNAGGFGPAASTAALSATVTGNTTITYAPAGNPGLLNTINGGAFDGAKGVMTVQQNNGNNNAMQSAIVAAVNYTTPAP